VAFVFSHLILASKFMFMLWREIMPHMNSPMM
jgi:hypothetical protein